MIRENISRRSSRKSQFIGDAELRELTTDASGSKR